MAIEKIIDINIQGNADEAVGSLRSQLKQAQAKAESEFAKTVEDDEVTFEL